MGRKDFSSLYEKCKQDVGGTIKIKISFFSDDFDKNKDYIGMIIYQMDGKSIWKNTGMLCNYYLITTQYNTT